jgi:uncharacterized membrane protein
MNTAQDEQPTSNEPKTWTVPPFPSTPTEFITILAHFHRAEIGRMAGWRERIDLTSNWAITVVAAMLSLSLSTPTAHHGVLLFAMLLVLLLLFIEARRYRFFDVYRGRVRQLERHYFSPIFAPGAEASSNWASLLGQGLLQPRFLMTHQAAVSRRLRRNYIWMFAILLLAWALKILTPKLQEEGIRTELVRSFGDIFENAALGPLPGWAVLAAVAAFYGWLAYTTLRADGDGGELAYGQVHV